MIATEFLLAWRYIKSKGRERAISAIASFSLIGIALGVATLIVVTSVMNGFRKEFTERVVGFNGHISIYPTKEINLDETVDKLQKINGIKKVVPGIEKQALISNRRNVRGSLTYGIRQTDLQNKSLISENIVSGSLESFGNDNEIVLGHSLATRSGLILGDEVVLIVPEMEETGFYEYAGGDGALLIEWAELIEEIIPEDATWIKIEKNLEKGFDYRLITISNHQD